MLQQILRDMYIDPQLLAELDEDQKQILFIKMREEQVARWQRREEQLDQTDFRPIPKKTPKPGGKNKNVRFLMGCDGQPWTWVMGEHQDDHSIDQILELEAKQKAQELAEQEITVTELEKQALEEVTSKTETLKVDEGPPPPATEDQVVKQLQRQRSEEIFHDMMEAQKSAAQVPPDISKEQDIFWQQQQAKAKEAERRTRAKARWAREEHKRLSQMEPSAIPPQATSMSKDAKLYPVEEVIRWFQTVEYSRGAVSDGIGHMVAPWFHGLLERSQSEELLSPQPCGTFLVRLHTRIHGYVISFKASTGAIKHYLVDASLIGACQFFGSNQFQHRTIADLVAFHMVNPVSPSGGEVLQRPCPHPTAKPNYLGLLPRKSTVAAV